MIIIKAFSFLSIILWAGVVVAAEATMPSTNETSNVSKEIVDAGFSDPNIASNLIQTTLGLLAVLAMIAAAAWIFKRLGNFQSGMHGKLKVIGGVSLGARERVVLLQVGEEQLVLGVAPGRIQTLHVLNKPLSVEEEGDSPTVSFSARLQSVISGRMNAAAAKGTEK
jgi:flagellar protein FliO/FliZ